MKRLLLSLLLFGALTTTRAQELPLWLQLEVGEKLRTPLLLETPDLNFSPNNAHAWQYHMETHKSQWEQKRTRQAQSSLMCIKEQFAPRNNRAFKVKFRVNAGNVINNWSPFPDRALDARIIRYPMPRATALRQGPKK